MARHSPLTAIFNPPIRYGEPTYTAQIGTLRPQRLTIGTATETDTAGAIGVAIETAVLLADFDFSVAAKVTTSSGNFRTITDNYAGIVASRVAGNEMPYPSGTQNGLNYLCNGHDDPGFVWGDMAVEFALVQLEPFTVQWVMCTDYSGALGNWLLCNAGNTVPAENLYSTPSGANLVLRNGSLTATGSYLGVWQVITFECNGLSSKIFVNNTQVASGDSAQSAGLGAINGNVRLFNNWNRSEVNQSVKHGQIRILSGILSSGGLTSAVNALRTKWGI